MKRTVLLPLLALVMIAAGAPARSTTVGSVPCSSGVAAGFPCKGIDLLAHVPLADFAGRGLPVLGVEVSGVWGWTDPETGDEYVIAGKNNGPAFFRVTDPAAPVYLGDLVNASGQLVWHEMKVYGNHAYFVSESQPYGMRVFDMRRLRGVTTPQVWLEDLRYPLNWSAHNIAINEETGTAYITGGNQGLFVPDHCLGGLHIVDITGPVPLFAGCWTGSGYVHDAQCVVYRGPDVEHRGKSICVNSAEDQVDIVDVTDPASPSLIGRLRYGNTAYTHQGWLTEDQGHFVFGDELDETRFRTNTRTLIADVRDLDAPVLRGEHFASTAAIDHNMYITGGLLYQSNYTAGLRVLDVSDVADGALTEVAYFDTNPGNDRPLFIGSWGNYPFFRSGTIAVGSTDGGLFLVKLRT